MGRQALIQKEQEVCYATEIIFETLSNKDDHPFNETVKSLQYCKLSKHNSENLEEWVKRLRIAATECNCQELDRQVKEQFIHGINDYTVMEMM